MNFIQKKIREFKERQAIKREQELQKRVYEIRYYIIRFFEDLEVSSDKIALPSWLEAKNLMDKLKINKDNPKTVNFYYKKLQVYKKENNLF